MDLFGEFDTAVMFFNYITAFYIKTRLKYVCFGFVSEFHGRRHLALSFQIAE